MGLSHSGKIGLQVLAWVPGAHQYVLRARPKHLKVLVADSIVLGDIMAHTPDTRITYRHAMELSAQQELLANPKAGAKRLADVVLKEIDRARKYIWAVEGPNETGLWDSADPYSLFTAEYARLLHKEGLPSIAYNFPAGNPPGYFPGDGNLHPDEFREGLRAYWKHYWDGLRESDYLGVHEYDSPFVWSNRSWRCLRYRRVWEILPDDCKKPILITEFGIDGGMIGRPDPAQCGWRAFDFSEEGYLDQIKWYANGVEKDDYVEGVHVFHAGSADPKWDSFSVLNCELISAYVAARKEDKKLTYAEQYSEIFNAWVAAGGIENNFLKHLIGTGEIEPTAEHLKMLASEVRASLTQLENALNAYPF